MERRQPAGVDAAGAVSSRSDDAALGDAAAAAEAPAVTGAGDLGERMVPLHGVIARLRRDCPWDRVQTHASLAPYALDEAAELAEALQAAQDALSGDAHDRATAVEDMVEELGDVLLQVLMNAAIGEQEGTFTLAEVLETVEAKMLRRHPQLLRPRDEAQRIFLAGYVAHLAMDEIWTQQIMWPLMEGVEDAGERRRRALVITLLMTRCDERDYRALDASVPNYRAPGHWLLAEASDEHTGLLCGIAARPGPARPGPGWC